MTEPIESSVPTFVRGVKYRFDPRRAAWVVLTPERVILPDETAQAVLSEIDGARSLGVIVDDLAARYQAPRAVIAADVGELLDDLATRGVVAMTQP